MKAWLAPHVTRPLRASLTVPGSKSLTNRFLVLGALAQGDTHLSGALRARDTDLMIDALQQLGATIDAAGTEVHVSPGPLHGGRVECGLAGTVMRFVPALAALADGVTLFDGDPAARRRPLAGLLDALADLGVQVESDDGRLPVRVTGSGSLPGGSVAIDASASSQFVSALLMIGPRMDAGLSLRAHTHPNRPAVPSTPHIDMTLAALRRFGANAYPSGAAAWRVEPGGLTGQRVTVEPDLSNAAPFLAAALAAGGRVEIRGWPEASTQAGALLPGLLERMGACVERTTNGLAVTGTGRIAGLHADLSPCGELTPTLAALAVLADGPSELTGIGHLAGHETDRLAAMSTEARRLGAQAEVIDDGLRIIPPPAGSNGLRPAALHAYDDHRMATFGAIVGLRVAGVSIDNIATTAKTLPQFPELWRELVDAR